MGTHVILRSRFFLPFTAREDDAHVSKWIFAFFPSSTLFPAAIPSRECRAWTPHHDQQNAKKVTVTTCPKFQARARAQVVSMTLLNTPL